MVRQHDVGFVGFMQRFRHVVLWFGLALCIFAVWRLVPDLPGIISRMGLITLAGWLCMLLVAWLASVVAWREVIAVFFGRPLAWPAALRQSGLLLVGKYVPGGVFGFLARASDGAKGESRSRHIAAGIYEQLGSLVVMALTGLVLLASSRWLAAWLLSLPLLPVLAMAVAGFSIRIAAHVLPDRIGGAASRLLATKPLQWGLFRSLCFMQLSATGWMLLVIWVAVVGFSQPLTVAAGLAGAFGLSVVVGIVAVFAPGGIGVRESAFVGMAAWWLPVPEAIALAAILRILSVVLDCLAGVVAMLPIPGNRVSGPEGK